MGLSYDHSFISFFLFIYRRTILVLQFFLSIYPSSYSILILCFFLPPVVCRRVHVLLILFVFVVGFFVCLFVCLHLVSYVPYVANFSGLSVFSSPCQRQCELLPSLGVRSPSSVVINFSHFNLLL